MDSIMYIYISWTIQGTWITYITFEREERSFSIITAIVLV